ncbi:hypothetical protein L9F63_008167, partial [Diploptera punctata]
NLSSLHLMSHVLEALVWTILRSVELVSLQIASQGTPLYNNTWCPGPCLVPHFTLKINSYEGSTDDASTCKNTKDHLQNFEHRCDVLFLMAFRSTLVTPRADFLSSDYGTPSFRKIGDVKKNKVDIEVNLQIRSVGLGEPILRK